MPDAWKLIDLLGSASDYFAGKGIENPRGNAEALLGKALELPRIELYLQYNRPLSPEEVSTFRELVKRRLTREPLQQILGQVEFCGCTIDVPNGLLVSRPETEGLVERILNDLKTSQESSATALDIGCGTGCIGIALAKSIPGLRVDAIDVDPAAVDCTRRNAIKNGVEDRVRVFHVDIRNQESLSVLTAPYDVLVSNPPYVTTAEYERLQPEITQFENRIALVGGDDGLEIFREIAGQIAGLVRPGGRIYFEIGNRQADAVRSLLQATCSEIEVHHDLAGQPRYIIATRRES